MNLDAEITADKNNILGADRIILPGVGHFRHGMKNLQDLDLIEVLFKKVCIQKTPILGICLGMQLLTDFSEEGNCMGLGFVKARTVRFNLKDPRLKVPHMGWNDVLFSSNCRFSKDSDSTAAYYFVHSYYVECANSQDVAGTTEYGIPFTSAFEHENITGVQFHPEKSYSAGHQLLSIFCS
jgi:glutamine amidotransferase